MAGKWFILGFILSLALVFFSWSGTQTAQASCGSVTCFVVIGSAQQVSPAGLLTVNTFYNYTPQGTLLSGTNGVIPAVDLDNRQLILGHHQEIRTISQMYTLDLNYGVTDQIGIEVAIPYKRIRHQHLDGLGEDIDGNGGAGKLTRFSETMEPTAQLGRGQLGLQGSIYQTYEIIPHRLNQFASASYRHTFRNNFGYQFGDQFDVGFGANLVTVPWLVLANQFNYRYMVHDSFSGSLARSLTPSDPGFPDEAIVLDPNITNRAVPTTGSTYFAYTPGFQVSLGELIKTSLTENASVYFYTQIPIARDFNGNLAQGVSYVFGITKLFQVMKPS